jgi:hypothetical protein
MAKVQRYFASTNELELLLIRSYNWLSSFIVTYGLNFELFGILKIKSWYAMWFQFPIFLCWPEIWSLKDFNFLIL